ncbi:MAG TPA: hypothetical protein VG757_07330 [Devosia sp.]|nr:hypothetical protein [Devosia sp.]
MRLLTVLAVLCPVLPAWAADVPERPVVVARAESAADYLDRLAVLLMIRSTFDVVEPDSIGPTLAEAAKAIGEGMAPAESSETLDRELLTEGGYYLVSLRYLALAGGAAWPDDRSEASYMRDSVNELEGLEAALIDSVMARRDPLPVLLAGQHIYGLTEGYATLPAEMDRFAGRDALVEAALASAKGAS